MGKQMYGVCLPIMIFIIQQNLRCYSVLFNQPNFFITIKTYTPCYENFYFSPALYIVFTAWHNPLQTQL